jgi:hypothetical protein
MSYVRDDLRDCVVQCIMDGTVSCSSWDASETGSLGRVACWDLFHFTPGDNVRDT